MKTKAELEEEITYLSYRVAALEGAVTAYRYALEQVSKPVEPTYTDFSTWPGLGQMQWYPTTAPYAPPNITS